MSTHHNAFHQDMKPVDYAKYTAAENKETRNKIREAELLLKKEQKWINEKQGWVDEQSEIIENAKHELKQKSQKSSVVHLPSIKQTVQDLKNDLRKSLFSNKGGKSRKLKTRNTKSRRAHTNSRRRRSTIGLGYL